MTTSPRELSEKAKEISNTLGRLKEEQLIGTSDPEDAARRTAEALADAVRSEPHAIAAARMAGLAGVEQEEAAARADRVFEDIRKALLDGDLEAYIRAHQGLGQTPAPNEIYDFRSRGGLPLLSSMRQLGLLGSLPEDFYADPRTQLGRRWQRFVDDVGRALGGDRRALRRAAHEFGIPDGELQRWLRLAAAGASPLAGFAAGAGIYPVGGREKDGAGGGGTGTGTGGVPGSSSDLVEERVTPVPSAPLDPPGNSSPGPSPNSGDEPPNRPPANDDADPGTPEDPVEVHADPAPGDNNDGDAPPPKGVVELGEGKDHSKNGARVYQHPDGSYTVYDGGNVETYDANGDLKHSWSWDPEKVNEAGGGGRPADDSAADSPLMPKVSWDIVSRPAEPPVAGAAPVLPVNPRFGEGAAAGGTLPPEPGVADPPQNDPDAGADAGPPRIPQGGGPIDPIDPEIEDEHPEGPPPDGGGGNPAAAPRARFLGPARALGRVAVGVGLFAGGFALGLGDRGPGEPVPAGGRDPAVAEAEPTSSPTGVPAAEVSEPGRGAPAVVPDAPKAAVVPATEPRSDRRPRLADDSASRQTEPDNVPKPDRGRERPGSPEDGADPEAPEEDPEAPAERDPGLGSLPGDPEP